jgi:hypothetical protein
LLLSSSLASQVTRGNRARKARLSVTMDTSLAELVEDWHDFDVLVGTAAVVGLVFVTASIGASVFTEKDRAALKDFSAGLRSSWQPLWKKFLDTRLEILWGGALIGRENCGRRFSTSLRRSICSGFISLRKQPIDVPPNDLIT